MNRKLAHSLTLFFLTATLSFAQTDSVGQVRHAPTLNGSVEGSLQQMTAENTTLNGGASVTGDLFIPGTPTIQLNGNPVYGGTLDGTGLATPTNHKVTLNGGATLRHVIRRTNPIALPVVTAPPQPNGTRIVSLNNSGQSPGDFATLKNLTLSSNVGQIVVPSGTYGDFTANSSSGFTLGVAGATTPTIYNFQKLTLNSNSSLTILGPVVVTLNGGFSTNGPMGAAANPEWLKLRIAGGGLSLNGNVSVFANLEAPAGTLTLNGNSRFVGQIATDRLIVNGNSLLRLVTVDATNQPPTVTLTAPAHGSSYQAPASFILTATASDNDGSVARVEFYSGATLLGQDTTAPYEHSVTAIGAGAYIYSARAIDNQGAITDSTAVTINVTSPNQPPIVALTTPSDGSLYTAPVTLSLAATASDPDGSIAKVEFYQGTTKLGEVFSAPFGFSTGSLTPGVYQYTAKAFDNQNDSAISSPITVTVIPANLSPTVTLTAPPDGSSFVAPAAFTLTANAADADGVIAKVEFFQGSTKIGEDDFAPFEHTLSGITVGTYSYLARATDNSGSSTDSAAITVTVVAPANVPPTVALTAPADGASFVAPATIELTATASDSDGSIAKVEFYSGPTKLGEGVTAPFGFSWTVSVAGNHSLTAVATDNSGASTTSGVVTVSIAAPPAGLPFLAGFEASEGYVLGPINGQLGWIATSASIVTDSDFSTGLRSVMIPGNNPPLALSHPFAPHPASPVVYVDMFTLPQAASTAETSAQYGTAGASRVAFVRNGTSGTIHVFNGNGTGGGTWQSVVGSLPVDADGFALDWLRLTIRSDYASKKWDLYLNGVMVAADVGFAENTQTNLGSFTLTGQLSAPTLLDDFLVGLENPLFTDADHDGMDDAWETAHGLNPAINDRDGDLDNDGLSNIQEYLLGTAPNNADSDGDGLSDKWEVDNATNPLLDDAAEDRDGDGLSNAAEYAASTNPNSSDTDGDGMPDGWEQLHGLNPLMNDATGDVDGDGVSNLAEFQNSSDPQDYYNGVLPQMTSLVAPDGTLGANDILQVLVTNTAGQPLPNAPVSFKALMGGHELAATLSGPSAIEIDVRSGLDGIALVYVRGGSN